MIEAGVAEVSGFELLDAWNGDLRRCDLVEQIYRAMYLARLELRPGSRPATTQPGKHDCLGAKELEWRCWSYVEIVNLCSYPEFRTP